MIKRYGLLLAITMVYCLTFSQNAGKRYYQEIFTNVQSANYTYGRNAPVFGDSIDLTLDLYEPVGDKETKRPLIVLAFGGAFVTGDRTQLGEEAKYFARLGYVAACIDYRIWPILLAGFPDSTNISRVAVMAISDMKASIRYLKSRAGDFKIDSSLIFVGGVSAGAVTAIQTAYLDPKDSISTGLRTLINTNGGFDGNSNTIPGTSNVKGVLNLSGAIFNLNWISQGEAPIASIHGTNDATVPFLTDRAVGIITMNGSGAMAPVLSSKKIPNFLVAVPGGQHTDIYFDTKYKPYLDSFTLKATKMFADIIGGNILLDIQRQFNVEYKIYPNPATDHLSIESEKRPISVQLYNLEGQAMPVQVRDKNVYWNTSQIPQGLYYAVIHFDAFSPQVISKIVIQ